MITAHGFYRVQVKHTTSKNACGYRATVRRAQGKMYDAGDFDILAVLAPAPRGEKGETWYLIPLEEILGKTSLMLPRKKSPKRNLMAQWRERWDLFV